jgi:hypothetical protein
MITDIPENTLIALESPEIYDGWSAAVLSSGDIINRWDPDTEPERHLQTVKLIQVFVEQMESKGFEEMPEIT